MIMTSHGVRVSFEAGQNVEPSIDLKKLEFKALCIGFPTCMFTAGQLVVKFQCCVTQ